ncbi:class I SAM-dependent methyltransferase [Salinimicrobium sp. CDJ15-81-2]|nr:class I SAM-dependent methyltransferase [Salinimicrobium nanhaiense]
MICPLCFSDGKEFYSNGERVYLECSNCKGIFVRREDLPDADKEKERYLSHNNDVNDLRYREFVSPIVRSVVENFDPQDHVGLDFGAGTGPVITKILSELDYKISAYDPFFLPDADLLKNSYDFIACCEVIEHFQNPAKEFELLRSLLIRGGCLICMTDIYRPTIDFGNWYYKNDPTHVFLYREHTFKYIKEAFRFSGVKIEKRLITFTS